MCRTLSTRQDRNEAAERAAELGVAFARAATLRTDPRFAELFVELVAEHTARRPR